METKSFMTGTALGSLTILVTGYLLFTLPPMRDFYQFAMNAGSATGVPRDAPLLWATWIGALSYAALITLAIGKQVRTASVGRGIRTGAVVGLLLWFTADFMLFAVSNVGNLTSTLVDPLLESIPGALAGGAIAAVQARASVVHQRRAPNPV